MVECTPPHSIRCEKLNKPWYEDKETEITVIVASLIAIVLCACVSQLQAAMREEQGVHCHRGVTAS